MHIDSNFDSGNIEVVDIGDDHTAQLKIRKDAGDEHMQWFYFRVDEAQDQNCTLKIVNAGQASYPKAWSGYRVCTSVIAIPGREWIQSLKRVSSKLFIDRKARCNGMPTLLRIPMSSTSAYSPSVPYLS